MSGVWTGRDVFSDLGVDPVINAHNDLTGLGGSLPTGPVVEAIAAANRAFIEVERLSDAAGEAIAEMLGIEAALVVPGAAAGAVLATAACITGGRDDLVARIPDTTGMAYEFLVPADRRTFYDRSLEGAGGKIVLAGHVGSTTASDIEGCITERTAGIFFYAPGGSGGSGSNRSSPSPSAATCPSLSTPPSRSIHWTVSASTSGPAPTSQPTAASSSAPVPWRGSSPARPRGSRRHERTATWPSRGPMPWRSGGT